MTVDRQGGRVRRAALFVDFENVYLGLRKTSPDAAERFATNPGAWVRWMEQDLGPFRVDDDEIPRALLRRICYLEPRTSGRYRAYFTRAGFRVVDCPALTMQGKNSADIHMVLDIVDTLAHVTVFDEFVVLSADADFTPVLLRLREHDRRTAILVSGPTAAALQAACDFAIPDTMFIEEALELDELSLAEPPPSDVPVTPAMGSQGAASNDSGLRARMEQAVRNLVASSSAPVDMATAAHAVRKAVGGTAATRGWAGAGTFKQFIASIQDDTLVMHHSQHGWIRDPRRHGPAGDTATALDGVPEVAHRVNRVVGAPLMSGTTYQALFTAIASQGQRHPTQTTADAARTIRDACMQDGHVTSRQAVLFVLLGLQHSGVDWQTAGTTAGHLATQFAENVLRLAVNAEMDLTDDERHAIRAWIAGP